MTIKELIKRLVDLPVDIGKATVTFQDGRAVITNISSSEDSGCYVIELPDFE